MSPDFRNSKSPKIIIAHRGASGYLPEHTLTSFCYAVAVGAHFIEPDLVMSGDGEIIVLHDIHLQTTTNVADIYPDRQHADGNFYAVDFSLKELKTLHVHERTVGKKPLPVYPTRFPLQNSGFPIPTFEEFLMLISGLEKSTGTKIGIYPELKAPSYHKQHALDLVGQTISLLDKSGYRNKTDQIYLQCFDQETLRKIKFELASPYPLIQLLGDNSWNESKTDYDFLQTKEGVSTIVQYADGVGPWLPQIIDNDGSPKPLLKLLKDVSLKIHPYTVRRDELPHYADDFDNFLNILFNRLDVDGIFTDFPDLAIKFLERRRL